LSVQPTAKRTGVTSMKTIKTAKGSAKVSLSN